MSQNIPTGKQQFIDINGKPLVGGKVYNYAVGTSTLLDTYQDTALTIPNTNPVVLDSRGQCVMYGSSPYRQVLTDSTGVTIWDQIIPVLSAGSVIFIGPDGTTRSVQDLSSKTISGASLVGYRDRKSVV